MPKIATITIMTTLTMEIPSRKQITFQQRKNKCRKIMNQNKNPYYFIFLCLDKD
jgi:hypothetical protein